MRAQRLVAGSLSVLAGLAWATPAPAQTPESPRPLVRLFGGDRRAQATKAPDWSAPVPIELLPPGIRENVTKVVAQPTLTAHAPAEEFRAGVYEWLVDHPDKTAVAWRRLGVPCVGIGDLGNGKYTWSDGQGSDLTWQTIVHAAEARVWYAEGQAKPGPMLPVMPVKAVCVLRFNKRNDLDNNTIVRHEVDVYLQTDSKAATVIAKLLGPTAPRVAENGASQLLLFYSAMARHLEKHPEQVTALFR